MKLKKKNQPTLNVFDKSRNIFEFFLNSYKLFELIWIRFNLFCHHDLNSDGKFGTKRLIKRQFDHDFIPTFSPSQFNCLSLVELG